MRKPKRSNQELEKLVSNVIDVGSYRYSRHALQRQDERRINHHQIIQTLLRGERYEEQDRWQRKFSCWNYAYRFHDKEFCESPIIVIVNVETKVIIITVMWDIKYNKKKNGKKNTKAI
ncbi:MAG: hypothetical protein K940chlam7_00666 [Chlamydiae bacterium]|nr:hypothetical protein [Chlamydiota bacterium]